MNAEKKKNTNNMILLVDGNDQDRANLSSRLRATNYSIESPLDGFHTLHLCERNNYDVILIASDMEDMPGYEIASLIRTQKKMNNIPIIFIPPKDTSFSEEEIQSSGINWLINHPYNFNHIVEALKKLL